MPINSERDAGDAAKVENCAVMMEAQRVAPLLLPSGSGGGCAGLLEAVCRKAHADDKLHFETETRESNVVCRCQFNEWTGSGRSSKEKDAKELASKEILSQIVKEGRHSEFSIHTGTKEEALEYVNKIHVKSNPDPSTRKSASENWFQECCKFCKSRKLENPSHAEIVEEGAPNDKLFCATVKAEDLVASGTARKKQEAKSSAYKNLYDLLLETYPQPEPLEFKALTNEKKCKDRKRRPLLQCFTTTPDSRDDEVTALLIRAMRDGESEQHHHKYEALLRRIVNMRNAVVMKIFEATNDESLHFSLAENNAIDNIQAFLNVKSAARTRTENVFGGQGPTEQLARDSAAWQALQFIYTFGGFAPADGLEQL